MNKIYGILLALLIGMGSCQSPISLEDSSDKANTVSLNDSGSRSGSNISYNGNASGKDVVLQGFDWNSKNGRSGYTNWYNYIKALAPTIKATFTAVWLPPPSASADGQGYMPSDWANLGSSYGPAADLKTLISTLHTNSVKALADIVINHRSSKAQCQYGIWDQYSFGSFGMGSADFMDKGVDIIGDGGKKGDAYHMVSGATEGSWSYGGRSYGNEDFGGSSDVNHWNSATRTTVKAWLNWLKNANNAGFDGWRFDMIGGYDPVYLGEYNSASAPYLSVGEKPSGDRQMLADMVSRSGNKTMVFDFPMRDSLASALGSTAHMYGNYLGQAGTADTNYGLIGWWSHSAMTLINNHDIQPGHETVGRTTFPWGIGSAGISTQAGYAFILTHPGIPSVFIYDWKDRGSALTKAINNITRIRQANNVNRGSRVYIDRAEDGLYAAYVGTQGGEQLAIKIGKTGWGNYEGWTPAASLGLTKAYTQYEANGHAYCVYYKNAVTIE